MTDAEVKAEIKRLYRMGGKTIPMMYLSIAIKSGVQNEEQVPEGQTETVKAQVRRCAQEMDMI